ncbi:MAG: hypothetical protein GF317_19240 [Candidatus Lokiarchaeota archaeon]|nr:hypothetical protein [Candidatus Lokiarchaeota archaeon]
MVRLSEIEKQFKKIDELINNSSSAELKIQWDKLILLLKKLGINGNSK